MSADHAVAAEHARGARTQPRRVAGWREHHAWSAAASLRRLGRRPFGTFLTVMVMGLALALPLAFALLLVNLQSLGDGLGRHAAVSVFLKVDQGAPQAELLAQSLRERADVAAVVVKTPQQGMDELAATAGFSGALHALDEHNPLPYVLELSPRTDLDADGVARLAADLRAERAVDLVQDSGEWRQRLDALLVLGRRIVAVLAVLLALAALLVVGNTVRMDIAGRSEEIGVLSLLGASRAFIRRPYLYAGVWYGLFAGVLAALLVLAVEVGLAEPATRLAAAYGDRVHLAGLPAWLLLAVPPAAALLGWLGARLVSARQLRKAA